MTDTVLVIGATGMLGKPVAVRLLCDGYRVRVLCRAPDAARAMLGDGFDYVAGDVRDPGALRGAVEGCRFVHVNLKGTTPAELRAVEVEGTGLTARVAKAAGVERLTYLSGAGIETASPRLLPVRIKQAAEAAIRASGVPYTILRASHFMESLDLFVRGRRAIILGRQPLAYHYLAADDYAGQVAAAFRCDQATNLTLTLHGPQPLTMEQALTTYVRLIRPDVTMGHMPLWPLRLIGGVTNNGGLKIAVALFDAFPRIPETGDTGLADQLLGPATTTIAEWCERRRAGKG
ncbi:MAG: NAD(P)H-binding protein [Sphingomonadaceae bacterium]|nr:NAD(P)H-binding protein [Sphingomonadaceae bacterium]